ncbi:MAG TPA: sodium:proton antiporter [Solirubrobacteraceae bacterium]|jgi:NhaP-type Na+/H+ or K+/H+ antiporter|nr:sodium:proton antiporter [Solirubrobacteraceae bacterium]
MPTFQATVTVLGVLLMLGALVSGLARRSMLSLAALFVLAGFLLGNGGLDLVDFRARSGFVEDLAFAALIVILFRDGLEVEGEMLQRAWHLPLRKLVLAMPLTTIIVAVAARALVGLSWTESFLLGALLAPTDPVLTSSIVTNPRVPRLVRHSLNLESGLNDGLALPAVLAFLAALSADSGNFVWWRFVLQDVGLGFIYGIACGWIASLLMPRESDGGEGERPADERIPTHQRSLFALGVAFATYGVTVISPKGNGFIAVFVAAIVLSVRRPDVRAHFERNSEDIVEIVKLGIFLVFGSLLTVHAFTREGWVALAFVAVTFLVARPLAVWIALIGTRTDAATRLFMGWFGPKGVASMTFALIVLDRQIAGGVRIFDLTALVVFCSIILHGISDTPGANWMARRAERAGGETGVADGAGVAAPAGGDGSARAQA